MTETLRFADVQPGMVFHSATQHVTADAIKAFAREFDPQPFHLDEEAARDSPFAGLAASGWHTTALTMRLLVEGGLPLAGGIVGAGIDELRWPRPLRPGDSFSIQSEVLEKIPSSSRPGQGRIRVAVRALLTDGTLIQTFVASLVMRG